MREMTKKRSWKSSGRLQISPFSHISTNMKQLMQKDPEYLQVDYRFHQVLMDEQIWERWRRKDPENLQVDYRFQFSNLIFWPCYKKKCKKNAWCIHRICSSVCDRQSATKPSVIFSWYSTWHFFTQSCREVCKKKSAQWVIR